MVMHAKVFYRQRAICVPMREHTHFEGDEKKLDDFRKEKQGNLRAKNSENWKLNFMES